MTYSIEVRVDTHDPDPKLRYEWRKVRPTNGTPYTWDTYDEAAKAASSLYPLQTAAFVRIVNSEKNS